MRIFALACVRAGLGISQLAAQSGLGLTSSAPVIIHGIRFVARTAPLWIIDPHHQQNIPIELAATNVSDRRIYFPTFDTSFLSLDPPHDGYTGLVAIRYGTTYTDPLDLPPGATSFILINGHLSAAAADSGYLRACDPTGTTYHGISLKPGRYSLSFGVGSTPKEFEAKARVFQHLAPPDSMLWSGAGETKSVSLRIEMKH